jgi:hypothetical protein
MSHYNQVSLNRFEELLGQAIESAIDGGISADYARKALVDDWELVLQEKIRRDRETLRKAL